MEKYNRQFLRSTRASFFLVAGVLLFTSCESGRYDDILVAADKIGELRTMSYEEYWKERIAADQEDERNGYPSKLSYPGHRKSGSISIMGRKRSIDISQLGPSSRACVEKWRSELDRNWEIGECRVQAICNLHGVLRERKSELDEKQFDELCSNVVRRAHLSTREIQILVTGK